MRARVLCLVSGLLFVALGVPSARAGDCRDIQRLSVADGYAVERVVAPERVYVERIEQPVYARSVVLRQRRPRRVVVERVRGPVRIRERVVDAGGSSNFQLGLFNFNR